MAVKRTQYLIVINRINVIVNSQLITLLESSLLERSESVEKDSGETRSDFNPVHLTSGRCMTVVKRKKI